MNTDEEKPSISNLSQFHIRDSTNNELIFDQIKIKPGEQLMRHEIKKKTST